MLKSPNAHHQDSRWLCQWITSGCFQNDRLWSGLSLIYWLTVHNRLALIIQQTLSCRALRGHGTLLCERLHMRIRLTQTRVLQQDVIQLYATLQLGEGCCITYWPTTWAGVGTSLYRFSWNSSVACSSTYYLILARAQTGTHLQGHGDVPGISTSSILLYLYTCNTTVVFSKSLKQHTSFGYMLEFPVGGKQLASSSLYYSKQEGDAASGAAPRWDLTL